MNRAKAIAKHCLECSGDSPKEVTLCHLFDCPLWQYRIGAGVKTKHYKKRIKGAIKRYETEVKELEAMGVDCTRFLLSSTSISRSTKKQSKVRTRARGK